MTFKFAPDASLANAKTLRDLKLTMKMVDKSNVHLMSLIAAKTFTSSL